MGGLAASTGLVEAAADSCNVVDDGEALISRCLSSPSFSSSLSDPSASNASARLGSTVDVCREFGDDAREWKEGGGEFGTRGLMGLSSSS